jgi:hypothetical protein
MRYYLTSFLITILTSFSLAQDASVAKQWNEEVLYAISADFARPTIHARNLFHASIAMYDAWMAYEPGGNTYLLGKELGEFSNEFDGVVIPQNADSAREMAMSYAVYRLIEHRYSISPGIISITNRINSLMDQLGYDPSNTSTDYVYGGPAELGNHIASVIIDFGMQDGSNEAGNHANLYYEPFNPPIAVEESGNPDIIDPNRWQQISLSESIDQSGEIVADTPPFLSPEWGNVLPFSMTDEDKTTKSRDGFDYHIYHDPGDPAYIDTTVASGLESFYKWNFLLVPIWQSHLDTADGVVWDVSPASIGNIQEYPETVEEYEAFYDLFEGGDPGEGYDLNPVTGEPYEPLMIRRADYARVLAEFWADGPESVTPPGHWFKIYNEVIEHPLFERKWKGLGDELDPLEYDARAYLALGGAMHDAAIAAWSIKGYYDYLRPVSAVRFMADRGQSSNEALPSYHPAGVPLIPGYIELVGIGDPLAGSVGEHIGKIKLYTWRGPEFIDDPETDEAGVGWILAENWWPYQRPSFVTPPFAGYVSGHSTYSRTAAELMSLMTGTPFFPGGMSGFSIEQNEFLVFEDGPSQSFDLQWATYMDASDQCSLSRIWGGIHPPIDDIPGRKIGMILGPQAFNLADEIITDANPHVTEVVIGDSLINELSIGEEQTITITFDQEMDQSVMPDIEFSNSSVSDVLNLISGLWISPSSFEVTYSINDELIQNTATTFTVKGALSMSGDIQNPHLVQNPFILDTQKPELVSVIPSFDLINDEIATSESLSIIITLNEPGHPSLLPLFDLSSQNELGETFALDIAESGWINEFSYEVVYLLSDEDVFNTEIHFTISNAFDAAANGLGTTEFNNFLSVDTENPSLVGFAVNDAILSIQDIGNTDLIIQLEFNEPMEENVPPALTFSADDPVGSALTYNPINSIWTSPTHCEVHYDFENIQGEFNNILISLEGFSDFNGNMHSDTTLIHPFTIDTQRPVVVEVSSVSETVSDQNLADGFLVLVEFSEMMNPDQAVLVLVTNEEAQNSLEYNFIESEWISDSTFAIQFDVTDENIELEDVGLSIGFAEDLAGNSQEQFAAESLFDIDTHNPDLISLLSTDYFIDDSDIGENAFQLVMIFDENMNQESEIEVTFLPEDPVNSILSVDQNSGVWINPLTLEISANVEAIIASVLSVDAEVSNLQDLAGNPMNPFLNEEFLSIDLQLLSLHSTDAGDQIALYPTLLQSDEELFLEFLSESMEESHIIFRDINGRMVHQKFFARGSSGRYDIDLPPLSEGFYLYEFVVSDLRSTGKLVIK